MNNFKTVRFLVFISLLNAFLFLLLTMFGEVVAFMLTVLAAHGILSMASENT